MSCPLTVPARPARRRSRPRSANKHQLVARGVTVRAADRGRSGTWAMTLPVDQPRSARPHEYITITKEQGEASGCPSPHPRDTRRPPAATRALCHCMPWRCEFRRLFAPVCPAPVLAATVPVMRSARTTTCITNGSRAAGSTGLHTASGASVAPLPALRGPVAASASARWSAAFACAATRQRAVTGRRPLLALLLCGARARAPAQLRSRVIIGRRSQGSPLAALAYLPVRGGAQAFAATRCCSAQLHRGALRPRGPVPGTVSPTCLSETSDER